MRLRPNPPRMVTVIIAIVLLVVGLAGTVISIPAVNEVLATYEIPFDRTIAYLALLAAPMLLVIGSLLPDI